MSCIRGVTSSRWACNSTISSSFNSSFFVASETPSHSSSPLEVGLRSASRSETSTVSSPASSVSVSSVVLAGPMRRVLAKRSSPVTTVSVVVVVSRSRASHVSGPTTPSSSMPVIDLELPHNPLRGTVEPTGHLERRACRCDLVQPLLDLDHARARRAAPEPDLTGRPHRGRRWVGETLYPCTLQENVDGGVADEPLEREQGVDASVTRPMVLGPVDDGRPASVDSFHPIQYTRNPHRRTTSRRSLTGNVRCPFGQPARGERGA